MKLMICRIVLVISVASCAAAQPAVTFGALLDEMTDLDGLSRLPSPAYTCRQFSSYDRASKTASDETAWFANGDVNQFIRVDEQDGRKEYVMMDTAGPGAIVRIWSANPLGTLRVYLDGSESPAIETPMSDYLGGRYRGVPAPIAGERSKGWNCYLPVPYAKHCRVTSDAPGFYYHVNYRTYAAGTAVETFKREMLRTLAGEIHEIAGRLAWPADAAIGEPVAFDKPLAAGATVTLAELKGPAKIARFEALVAADDLTQALRQVVLEITFDGETTVRCPIGDFFGAAPGVNAYESLPATVRRDGVMSLRWPMPFEKSAVVRVRSGHERDARVIGSLNRAPYEWNDRSLHFHAKWRAQHKVPTRPMIDWSYLDATGDGVFVGAAFNIANPTKLWWGEGDEKIYVDGEEFPSHFGTGTEDYYGYAWCYPIPFEHAYHNQPRCDGPGNYGHTAVNRWHVLDRIPFRQSLRFDMELWHWNANCEVDMAVTAYWYARPGGGDKFAEPTKEDLALNLIGKYTPARVAGAIEGEELKVLSKTAKVEPQDIAECSNDRHLWWHDGVKVGDRLVLGLPVSEPGQYRVHARFMMAGDYGVARIHVNDQAAGEPLDFYNAAIKVSDEREFGVHALRGDGTDTLMVEIVGANEKAKKDHLFGLDYVRLERLTPTQPPKGG